MADLQAVLERQTGKVEELRKMAEESPSVASVQALSSIYASRGDTHAAMGQHEQALQDRQAASGLLAQVVLGAGRDDLLDNLLEAGDKMRQSLLELGRHDEAFDHTLGETQLLAASGQSARAVAQMRRLLTEREQALNEQKDQQRLDQYVKVAALLAGTLYQSKRPDEALEVENAAIDRVASFEPKQPVLLNSLKANRALTRAALHKSAEAHAELDEVIGSYDQLLAEKADAEILEGAIEARSRKAQLLLQQDKLDDALQSLQETSNFAEEHAKDEATEAIYRQTLRQIAEASRMNGRIDAALEAAQKWNDLVQRKVEGATGAAAGDFALLEEAMEAAFERALLLHLANRYDESLAEANQLLGTWNQLAQAQPDKPELQQRVLMSLDLRERNLASLGRHEEAVRDQSAIIQAFQQMLQAGGTPQLVQAMLTTLQRRAESLQKLGRMQEAQQDLGVVRQILERLQGDGGAGGAGGTGGPAGGPAGGGAAGGGPAGGSGIII